MLLINPNYYKQDWENTITKNVKVNPKIERINFDQNLILT